MRKRETILRDIDKYERKRDERIKRGRTRGAGAGGYNRDIDNICHRISLLKEELKTV